MRHRIAWPLGLAATLAVTGLSVGNPMLLAAAGLLILLVAVCGVSVLWAARTLQLEASLSAVQMTRGERCRLNLTVRHRCPLPLAPVTLWLDRGPGTEPVPQTVSGTHAYLLPALHVGVSRPGVIRCALEDPFGFFRWERETPDTRTELTVTPAVFPLTPLTIAPADQGLGTMARAKEDASDPMEIRSWQRGDSLKKVHWKLSARRRELLVRRFEEPAQPEVLVLLDGTAPEPGPHTASIRDALLETTASVLQSQQGAEHEVRLSLGGVHPTELNLRMGMPALLRQLAQMEFSPEGDFCRELQLAAHRLRQVGATVVITGRLDGETADRLADLRRLGPTLRLYLIQDNPPPESWRPLLPRLAQAGVEVFPVDPVPEEVVPWP